MRTIIILIFTTIFMGQYSPAIAASAIAEDQPKEDIKNEEPKEVIRSSKHIPGEVHLGKFIRIEYNAYKLYKDKNGLKWKGIKDPSDMAWKGGNDASSQGQTGIGFNIYFPGVKKEHKMGMWLKLGLVGNYMIDQWIIKTIFMVPDE